MCHRNQTHQEQLWEVSCNLLKDYLSTSIWIGYGPKETEQQIEEGTTNWEEAQEPGRGEVTASTSRVEPQEPAKYFKEQIVEGTTKGDSSAEELIHQNQTS